MRRSFARSAAGTVWALVLPLALACGGGEPEAGTGGGPGGAADAGAASEPEPVVGDLDERTVTSPTVTETVSLSPVEGLNGEESDVDGDVTFARDDEAVEVHVVARELSAPVRFPLHLRRGMCGRPSPMVIPPKNVSAPGSGAGEWTTGIDTTRLEPGNEYLVLLRGRNGAPLGCAEVPAAVVEG